jgi:1-phosphofructokinase family hexose kinase
VIVATGLTPANQQILRFTKLEVGEVNRAAETAWCASGKVLNVGAALATLGAPCRVVSPVGAANRDMFEREFSELGATVEWVVTERPTRVCTTVLDEATGRVTELVENAPAILPSELAGFHAAFDRAAPDAAVVVLTGSLPAAVPTTIYRELSERTAAKLVVDARGPELLALLDGPHKPFLVKPNREELARTVGHSIDSDAALHAAMRELIARGTSWVVVSQGKDAVLAASRDGLWRLTPPRVERVVNPIGCGDCLAAGIAYGLFTNRDPLEAVALGMSAAAENLPALLPARINPTRVETLATTIHPERIA